VGGLSLALLQVTPEGLLSFVVGGIAWANLVIGVLNLVPGMPLDGGRVLRAAVWRLTGNPHRGTVAAGWTGRVVAVAMLLSPFWMQALGLHVGPTDWLIALVFGWFLWSAATAAVVSGKVRSRLPALRGRALARRTLTAPEDLPIAEAVRRAHEAQAGAIVALDGTGRPVGVVNEAAVQATPQDRRAWVTVAAVSRSLGPGLTLPADIAGEDLVRAMQGTPASEYLLVEPDGSIYGVLTSADVDAAFQGSGGPDLR
jgi:hypothetical protein